MTAYVVKLPDNMLARNLVDGINLVVVEADSEAQAKSMAKIAVGGDANSAWDDADVTAAGDGGDPANFDLHVAITAPGQTVPTFEDTYHANDKYSVFSYVLANGGTSYQIGDGLSVDGAEGDVFANYEVTGVDEGTGAITGIRMVFPGLYALDVSDSGVPLSGGSGDANATINVQAGTGTLFGLVAQAWSALTDTGDYPNLSYQDDTGLFQIDDGSANIGDSHLALEFLTVDRNGDASDVPVAGMTSDFVHQGSPSDALSVTINMPTVTPKILATAALKS